MGNYHPPLHNPPMRVYALPHKFVYSLSPAFPAGVFF